MSTAVATTNGSTADIIHDVITKGDLANLSPEQRARYYVSVCESMGLNRYTQPFAYISLNGKLTLYATKGATDQLRGLRGISIRVTSRETMGDLYVVTVEASTADGRTDSDIGAVSIAGLKGEALANSMMKAVSKAKRRVTLSLCGLGMLDETEIESIPDAEPISVNVETGEIVEPPVSPTRQIAARNNTPTKHDNITGDEAKVEPRADMKRLHAAAAEHGISHMPLSLLARANHGVAHTNDLTVRQGEALIATINRWRAQHDDPVGWGVVTGYLRLISTSSNHTDLARIGAQLKGAGIDDDTLRDAYRRRVAEVPPPAQPGGNGGELPGMPLTPAPRRERTG